MTDTEIDRYVAADEQLDTDILAPPEHEQWDIAVRRVREVLKTLEAVDWHRGDGVADAETAIEHELDEAYTHLHDAFDEMKHTYDD